MILKPRLTRIASIKAEYKRQIEVSSSPFIYRYRTIQIHTRYKDLSTA